MSMIKYRIHEVAKDFNVPSKVISQILTDYIAPPKNHMQVLENNELDVIFDYMTQHNQVANLQDIFNVPPKAEDQGDAGLTEVAIAAAITGAIAALTRVLATRGTARFLK